MRLGLSIISACLLPLAGCAATPSTSGDEVADAVCAMSQSASRSGDTSCWTLDSWPVGSYFGAVVKSRVSCDFIDTSKVWVRSYNDTNDVSVSGNHWLLISKADPTITQTSPTDWEYSPELWARNQTGSGDMLEVEIHRDVACGGTLPAQASCPVPMQRDGITNPGNTIVVSCTGIGLAPDNDTEMDFE